MSADQQVLESLAFLYLTFGHSTDGTLTKDEMNTLAGKLREWAPSAQLGDIGEILKTAVTRYKAANNKLAAARDARFSLGALGSDQLRKILEDLQAIAAADGHISPEEQSFIAETAESFGL